MKALVLNGPNHAFDKSAPIIHEFLSKSVDSTITDDKNVLADGLRHFDVLVFGTGFTRRERLPDGARKLHYELTEAQEEGLYRFVREGKGLVGIHGTGWWTSGRHAELTGGHANWHPPGLHFTVKIEEPGHPITQGIGDFEVDDEIYMSAYDPTIKILASASWSNVNHPMAWTHSYGKGRVFFTTLGHGPNTFEVPAVQRLVTNAVVWASGQS
ncbi:MAG TPA: ThuA domain-containing protein [Chloroflexota bacterium]|nr:ThuA domain-containing protein [Chloroflexota bacterium]